MAGLLLLAASQVQWPALTQAAPVAVSLPTESLASPAMQSLNAPARIARIAEVPGTGGAEAWAIGYSTAAVPGWSTAQAPGQVLLLHYTSAAGWQIAGTPTFPGGAPDNDRLLGISAAPSGEAWAVGEKGHIVHHPAGSSPGTWTVSSSPTGATLEDVSLAPDGSAGWAVGDPDPDVTPPATPTMTILRLSGGSWTAEAGGVGGTNPPGLIGVSAVSGSEAWAVSGEAASNAAAASVSVQALFVYHRVGGAWQRVTTGENMFDGPPATAKDGRTTVESAAGGAVAANADGAWVVGRIEPNQTGTLGGDTLTGDRSRPFAIWFSHSGAARPYCPAVDSVSASNGAPASDAICDNPLPLSAFAMTSVDVFPAQGGSAGDGPDEAFAGGMGLLHFTPAGGWHWAEDPVGYVASMSFASPQEGWIAGTGGNAAGSALFSQGVALGHWTLHPQDPAAAAWPDPGTSPVQGVALDPDGSGAALGVGSDGTLLHYVSGRGWILQAQSGGFRSGADDFHAIAWPAPGAAWAVGNSEEIASWNGAGWDVTTGPVRYFQAEPDDLFGVAFADATTGWAVGSTGLILDHSAHGWRRDQAVGSDGKPLLSSLYTVAAVPGGAVAAGANGTVVTLRGGSWQADPAAAAALAGASSTPVTFYASATLPDGTAALGGSGGAILLRSPQGAYRLLGSPSSPTVDGTVIAMGLAGSSADPQVLASVDPDSTVKYVGGQLVSTQGWLYLRDAAGWHDIELGHQVTAWTSTDTAAVHDPALAIALKPGTLSGWAGGGYPANTRDDETHSVQSGSSTGSVYRVDVGGDPRPPSELVQVPKPPTSGFRFAYLGDSACGSGLCGPAFGTGTMADAFLLDARQEIGETAPDLTVFGGDMRRVGLPSELDTFKQMATGWPTAFFAAMGCQDLLDSSESACAPGQTSDATAGNGYYLQAFHDMAAPWGDGTTPPPPGVTPVSDGTATAGEARTHYAFDYTPPGSTTSARFVVLNDSDGTLADSQANPGGTQQTTWLAGVLNTALPVVIVMNEPVADPRLSDAGYGTALNTSFTTAIASHPLPAALFSSFFNDNVSYSLTTPAGALTGYVSGGAGSPLDTSSTHNPLHGYYHAWLLVSVDPTKARAQQVTVQSMPILQSVAMRLHPQVGRPEDALPAGSAVIVDAVGRTPDAGLGNVNGPAFDPLQSRAQYMVVPNPRQAFDPCTLGEADNCSAPYAIQPYHYFTSEDPRIAQFVKPCPSLLNPAQPCAGPDDGFQNDPYDGYLCLKNPGTTFLDVVVGIHAARQQITVGQGQGKCRPVVSPALPLNPAKPAIQVQVNPQLPAPAPVVPPAPVRAPAHHFFHPVIPNNVVAAVVPPPVPVLAVGPPLPAAGTAAKKEEEREKAFEHSKEQGGHHAVAYSGAQNTWDARPIAAAGAGLLFMFILSAAWSASARRRPAAARIDTRRWE